MICLLTNPHLSSAACRVIMQRCLKLAGACVMSLDSLNFLLLGVSIVFLFVQLFIKQKQTAHLIFAVFCGSVAMVALKKLTGEQIGAYQYLIGMATCATCNAYWLFSRSLFRTKNAIALPHILMAVGIALLIMTKQGYLFVTHWLSLNTNAHFAQSLLGELTGLLSSCIIVLTMWEGFQGYQSANQQEQAQRRFFIATIVSAVGLSTLANVVLMDNPYQLQWAIGLITLVVLVNSQLLLTWRFRRTTSADQPATQALTQPHYISENQTSQNPAELPQLQPNTDAVFVDAVQTLIIAEQRFLQANLKVGDVAKELNVPEYRISKTLREHLGAKNFNDYINKLRIDYACQLLADPSKQHWSVLVVSLESGFASVGPFTRAFKAFTGYTPNQYRIEHLAHVNPQMG